MLRRALKPELAFWLLALAYLAWTDPAQPHVSLCLFDRLGFTFCPGCGLGRSIAYLLDGNLAAAWDTHILGVFALPVIIFRIIQLTINNQNYGKRVSHPQSRYAG